MTCALSTQVVIHFLTTIDAVHHRYFLVPGIGLDNCPVSLMKIKPTITLQQRKWMETKQQLI